MSRATPRLSRAIPRPNGSVPRGAALISAMALVMVVTSLTVGLAWLGYSAIARLENQRDSGQARLLAQAMMDYARWILTSDLRGAMGGSATMDHLSEPWAQPIPHSRLNSLLGAQMTDQDLRQFGQASIAGQMVDEQARFNLEALVKADGLDARAADRLARLTRAAGLSSQEHQALLEQVLALVGQTRLDGAGRRRLVGAGEVSVWQAFEQRLLPGLGLEGPQQQALRRWLTWLPERTPINVNTASAEVLQAVLEMDSLSTAERIVAQRDRIPFRSLAEFTSFMPPGQSFETVQFDMKTKYFRAIGYAQFGRAEQAFEVLLRREGGRVSVVDYVVLD